LLWTSP